jgi:hypothetical protein
MDDTRPIPKRTLDDFRSLHKLAVAIEELAPDATPWQVATRCATAITEALGAHAVVIHQHDARGELRCIGVHGPNAGDLLGTTTKVDDDHVVTAVLTNQKFLVLRFDGALPRFVPDRHRLLGTSGSLAVFPVMAAAGCVGIIEIVGVGEDRRQAVTDAYELVAGRLATALDSQPNPAPPAAHGRPRMSTEPRAAWSDAESRALTAPVTFPKRAPTLVCRPLR